jgi:hypothetical protein
MLDLSKGPNRVGVFLPSPVEGNRYSFRNVFPQYSEFLTMDKVQNPGNSESYAPSSEPFALQLQSGRFDLCVRACVSCILSRVRDWTCDLECYLDSSDYCNSQVLLLITVVGEYKLHKNSALSDFTGRCKVTVSNNIHSSAILLRSFHVGNHVTSI